MSYIYVWQHGVDSVDSNVQTITFRRQYFNSRLNMKKITGTIVGIIAFALSYFVVKQIFFKPVTFDKAMMKAASDLNKTCPIMIDKDTRLDNAVALPNNKFQYNYTMVNMDKSELDVDIDTLKNYMEPVIINNARTNPSLKTFRENKVTLAYNYRDKNGVFILEIKVTPDLYAK